MAARTTDADRPSPEALLEQAKKEGRGKLKIFLGAAPGVGKTFEMLTQGRQRRLEGVDVVIGVVETHGRIETEALTKGFEVIPKKRSLYKGHLLAEMDIDAVLQRRPALVLVDELAHTNAEGSRHPKRYIDVEELLAAGIDVYSTLNVQHVESLNDVVAQITHVQVRETVPDNILDQAAEIELVDTTAEDLLKRLREGKVYVPEQAERALKHFFTPGNLTALRELAMRRAAQRVDREMTDYLQAHAMTGTYPAGERILVCVNEHPSCAELVRRARRLADNFKATWTALYVESPRHLALSEIEKDRVSDTLRLAQRLGGEAVTIPGRDIAATLLEFSRKNNVTQILIGKSMRSRWFELLHGSVVRDLMAGSGAISVTAVVAEATDVIAPKGVRTAVLHDGIPWRNYLWSALALALTIVVAKGFTALSSNSLGSVGMIFLIPVLLSAIWFGLRPALVMAVASVLSYNFFFLPPLYTFTIADPNNWLSFGVLLIVAVAAANLASRVSAQANLAAVRAAVAGELYQFTGKLAGIARLDDILWAAAFQIASMLRSNVVILLPDIRTQSLEIRSGYPPEDELDAQDLAAARWCWEKGAATGRNTETFPGAKRLFLPMRTGQGLVGVIGLLGQDGRGILSPDDRRLLDALLDQTALAIERSQLVEQVDQAQVRAEADKLRVSILTSLSHDLRTPLASILGSATSLLSGARFDTGQTEELLLAIRDEAERLDRFVGNLLDMSRLEAGALGVRLERVHVKEVVEGALKRLHRRLSGHLIEVDLPDDLPLVSVDSILIEQALANILDNAAKYAPPGTRVRIAAKDMNWHVSLMIEDEGPGIPQEEIGHIFDKFYRARDTDRRVAGTGLGLAVARGFVEAFGGTLDASNRSDTKGAMLTLTLPKAGSEPQSGD